MRFGRMAVGLGVAASMLMAAPASSRATTLADLFAGGSILIDEGNGITKLFDNFVQNASTGTNPLNPANITVLIAPSPPPGEVGLLFNISTGGNLGSGQSADLGFSFQVHCTGCLIHDDTLTIAGGQAGTGMVGLSENVVNLANLSDLSDLFVFLNSSSSQSTDHGVLLNDVTDIKVTKDLNINGGNNDAFVSDFAQTFSQTIVPGPASLILIGSGLFGIGVLGRMKRQA